MTDQKNFLSLDVSFELPEQWMMGVTSLKVNNSVYNITPINNRLEILLTEQQLKSLNIDTQLAKKLSFYI